MHELALAEQAVRLISEDAQKRGIKQVKTVKIVAGPLAAVMPQAFSQAFDVVVRETILDAARLILETDEAAGTNIEIAYYEGED